MEIISDHGTFLPIIAALIAAGAAIGFLAGVFGVGGGAISVPVFFEIFGGVLAYPPDVAMPIAVGTSLAVIIPTSISSAHGHYKKGTLNLQVLSAWALPILSGVILGAVIASFSVPVVFQAVFVLVALLNAVKLLSGGNGWQLSETLPSKLGMRLSGLAIGLASSIMGIGGGALSNLFLTMHGVPIHRAISTSAGVGVLIALPGAIGYIFVGLGRGDLPPGSLGFVSIVAFALTIPTSLITTRFGVALAHRLPRRSLEIAFGGFLSLVAARFIWAIFY